VRWRKVRSGGEASIDLAQHAFFAFPSEDAHLGQTAAGLCTDYVCFAAIVLQKSKVAAVQIFGENLKRKVVNDSHCLSRATEVAHEFGAGR
jgi:hypothetical protein